MFESSWPGSDQVWETLGPAVISPLKSLVGTAEWQDGSASNTGQRVPAGMPQGSARGWAVLPTSLKRPWSPLPQTSHAMHHLGEEQSGIWKTASWALLLLLSRFSRVRLCAIGQLTRLLRPWDSPGKNTGVGCHFLLQCRKVKSESEVAQSCPTLSHPMDCSPPGSCIHGIFQARVLEWVATAFSDNDIHPLSNISGKENSKWARCW